MKIRISHAMSPQDIDDFNAAIATQRRILLKAFANTNLDDLKSGQYMGTEGGWKYCKLGYTTAQKLPKLYDDEELNIEEYAKGIDLAQFLIDAKAETETIDNWVGMLFALDSKDLMEAANYMRQRATSKKGLKIEYAEASAALDKMYNDRAAKAEETRKKKEFIESLKAQIAKPTAV